MAAPTPVTNSKQSGTYGYAIFQATWSTSDQYADEVVVDLSALADDYTDHLTVRYAYILAPTDMGVTLEFDRSTDAMILNKPVGFSGVAQQDFTPLIDNGVNDQDTGDTGDIVVTTVGAVSGNELYILVEYRAWKA